MVNKWTHNLTDGDEASKRSEVLSIGAAILGITVGE